jgi:DNA-directed RNA polymerase subunit RPC12/RpoP
LEIGSNHETRTRTTNPNYSASITTLLSKTKPMPSRLDYRIFNFCATCNLKFSKEVLRCPDCNQKVRVKPWHRSKIVEKKRI